VGLSSGSTAKERCNVANALSRRDVAGSVWCYVCAARLIVSGIAGAVAAEDQETYQRISTPGQGESVSGDQGGDEMLTFDLSIPILKRLITGSQSFYRKVRRDANWASRWQLSVNDQSLVLLREVSNCGA
jgi:hypothetical protein